MTAMPSPGPSGPRALTAAHRRPTAGNGATGHPGPLGRRARLGTVLSAVLVLLALGVVVPQSASAATRPVLQLAPLSGTLSTAAGLFRVTGVASVAAPSCSAQPSDPCRFLTAVAAIATHTDTGRRCLVADAVPVNVVRDVPTTIGASYRVIPSNPIQPGDPCQQLGRLPVTFGLTFTADGTLSTISAAPRAPAP